MLALIVAIVILTTAVMAITAANTARLKTQTVSSGRSSALAIARSYMETVRGRDPWTLESETAARVDGAGIASATGAFTRELRITATQANLVRAKVIVTAPRLATPVQLITDVYRPRRIQ